MKTCITMYKTLFLLQMMFKVTDHIKLLDFLTDSEKLILASQYKEEFEFCTFNILVVSFHMVLRCTSLKKKKTKNIKKQLKKIINKDICKAMIKNKHAPLYNKIECLILRIFGLSFYLFFFPFFHFTWKVLSSIKRSFLIQTKEK